MRDVAAFAGSLARLGLTTTDLSTCTWDSGDGVTTARAASVVFPGQYLDLVEERQASWLAHIDRSAMYGRGAAPSAIVLSGRSQDEIAAMAGAYRIVRSLPGASPPEIEYTFAFARDAGLPVGLVHDAAPGAMRTERWMRHGNTAVGIRKLWVRLPTSTPLASWLHPEALGVEILHDAPVEGHLAAAGALVPKAERATLLSLELSVADLDAAAHCLEAGALAFTRGDGRLSVAPREGFGTGIELVDLPAAPGGADAP